MIYSLSKLSDTLVRMEVGKFYLTLYSRFHAKQLICDNLYDLLYLYRFRPLAWSEYTGAQPQNIEQ
jgi:hypothetical protein